MNGLIFTLFQLFSLGCDQHADEAKAGNSTAKPGSPINRLGARR